MKIAMPWLKDRLRKLGKTPTALARELKIEPPRVYEMIAGRRAMQPREVAPTARFLEWSIEELLQHLPPESRVMPTQDLNGSNHKIPLLGTTQQLADMWDCVLTGETRRLASFTALEHRTDLEALYVHTTRMAPWREQGDVVIYEKTRPPMVNDYVVIFWVDNGRNKVLVRQLIEAKDHKLVVRQHNPDKKLTLNLKEIASCFRVLTWIDCLTG
jgi:hypothetical protein